MAVAIALYGVLVFLMDRRAFSAIAAILVLAAPSAASTQETGRISRGKLIAVNVLLGGAAGGVGEAINGRSFWRGFLNGSLGGATIFAGKCLIAQEMPEANWLGRVTVSVGSSMVANAREGRAAFSRLIVPLGPVRVYRDNRSRKTTFKLDFQQLVVATYMGTRPGTSFDLALSGKTGGLVFHDPASESAVEVSGVIRVWSKDAESTLAHELTHVAQGEFVAIVVEEPLERRLLSRLPGGKAINRYVDLGILSPVWAGLNELVPASERPWEKEAASFGLSC